MTGDIITVLGFMSLRYEYDFYLTDLLNSYTFFHHVK